jgi:type VI secretion system protein VasD
MTDWIRSLALVAGLSGCAPAVHEAKAPEKCPPQHITVSLLASARVNPTRDGAPRPVVVRVYQLRSDVRLANAGFERLWHDDKTSLGDDLVKVDEHEVYPGGRLDMKFDRSEAVDHVAAVALFQSPQGRSWAASLDLPPRPAAGAACGGTACEQDDDGCSTRHVAEPHLSFYLDGNTIDDGVEHLDDFPPVGVRR